MSRGPNERTMLDALWARLSRQGGMSARHVMAEHVRYDPGWGHSIADAISVDTWRDSGRGQCLHGYEVKVSRSDFLREVREPGKHEVWAKHCRYWWIVVPDTKVVTGSSGVPVTPYGWGVLVLRGRWLQQVIPAQRRPGPEPLPWRPLAGLMRATAQTAAYHALTPAQRLLLDRMDPETTPPSLLALRAPVDT